MTRVDENDVANALSKFEGEDTAQVGDMEVDISIDVNNIYAYDSPDCIFSIELEYELFGQQMSVTVPLPVEAEAAGLDAAVEDLDKLIERKNHVPQFPMLVVAEHGWDQTELERSQPVRYSVRQVPLRRLKMSD